MAYRQHRTSRGLGLVELVTTLAIASLLLAVTVPVFADLAADARRAAQVNTLVRAAHFARHAAAVRGRPIVLCPMRGETCAADGDWREGFMVFANDDDREPPGRDPGEPVLLRAPSPAPLSLVANRRAFSFRPVSRRDTNGTIAVCDPRGAAQSRLVVVSPTGRPRVAPHPDARDAIRCGG